MEGRSESSCKIRFKAYLQSAMGKGLLHPGYTFVVGEPFRVPPLVNQSSTPSMFTCRLSNIVQTTRFNDDFVKFANDE